MDRHNELQPGVTSTEELNEKIVDASKAIFSYCMAKTLNRTEAEDLCQDILCELVKSVENLRDTRAFYGFMWAVAGNVYRQWCRKKARLSTCELTEDIPSEESVPGKVIHDEENSDLYLLRRELTLLSEKYRQAVILYYIDGKSCTQISRILAISESRVKYLLFKSRNILKEGMNMERKLGTLSYNPKNLIPMYNGTGPNRFWEFMQSKIRQNIANACYNDSLTQEQISLEIGIPLPYLDSEINILADKNILFKEGKHYKANLIILTAECADEIIRSSAACHKEITALIAEFLDTTLPALKQIGFSGADFSENSLRWQLVTFLLRGIADFTAKEEGNVFPLTAWGDRAYLWLAEEGNALSNHLFNFCQMESRRKDRICFTDYVPAPKGSHLDFYGNDHYINLLCDIAHGRWEHFSGYDLEAVAELIRKGYVLKEKDTYTTTIPLFTAAQAADASRLVENFVSDRLSGILNELTLLSAKILEEHTPKYLRDQVPKISSRCMLVNAGYIPLKVLIDQKILSTDWNPMEMPTTHIVLAQ